METITISVAELVEIFNLKASQSKSPSSTYKRPTNVARILISSHGIIDEAESEPDETIQNFLGHPACKECITCNVLKDIKEADHFPAILENLACQFKLSSENKKSLILEGTLCKGINKVITDYVFDEKTKTDLFIFGRVATVQKYKMKFDMAYAFYTLEFKLPPTIQKRLVEKFKIFGIAFGEKEEKFEEEQYLDCKEKESIKKYVKTKTITTFRDQYKGMIDMD